MSNMLYNILYEVIVMKNHLRIFREKMGWTQEELARKVGVSRQTINYIEKGRYQPSVRLALKLSTVLKCKVEDIFELERSDWG